MGSTKKLDIPSLIDTDGNFDEKIQIPVKNFILAGYPKGLVKQQPIKHKIHKTSLRRLKIREHRENFGISFETSVATPDSWGCKEFNLRSIPKFLIYHWQANPSERLFWILKNSNCKAHF